MAGVTGSIMLGLAGYQAFKSITAKGPAAPVLPPAPVAPVQAFKPRANRGNGTSRNPSLLTGPLGVTSPTPTTRKSLLGM